MIRDHIPNASLDITIASIASRGMGGGTAATIFGWFMSNEVLAFTGVAITLLGFIINFIFQRRRDKREQAEFQMKVELHKAQLAIHKRDRNG